MGWYPTSKPNPFSLVCALTGHGSMRRDTDHREGSRDLCKGAHRRVGGIGAGLPHWQSELVVPESQNVRRDAPGGAVGETNRVRDVATTGGQQRPCQYPPPHPHPPTHIQQQPPPPHTQCSQCADIWLIWSALDCDPVGLLSSIISAVDRSRGDAISSPFCCRWHTAQTGTKPHGKLPGNDVHY